MKVFVIGATGYIGGSVAARLREAGHRVIGLVRTEESAAQLREGGIEPLLGSLSQIERLEQAAHRADAVINAAEAIDRGAVEALLKALAGSGKVFIHTSGSGVVGDLAAGEPGEHVFDEATPFTPIPLMQGRFDIDRMVVEASARKVRSVVLRPSMIYGQGLGLRRDSFQVPVLIAQAKASGVPRHVGRGLNIWSHVHIDDLADLYLLALERAPGGSLYYVEHGEDPMQDVVHAIRRMLGLAPDPQSWPLDEAVKYWGPRTHVALGSNSRVRADKARKDLGWTPKGAPLLQDIEYGSYREQHRA